MRHRGMPLLAIAGVMVLMVGPALAQSGGSGTAPPTGSGAATPGMTTSPQPAPSPTPPGPASPSVGATPGKAGPATGQSGSAQPGTSSSGTSQIGSGGAPTDPKQSGATNGQASTERVKELQQALQDKGMDPGPIDGIMGPKTQAALRAFQQDQKLPPTGRMDDQTLAKLGVSR